MKCLFIKRPCSIFIFLLSFSCCSLQAAEIDETTGLIKDDGWQYVIGGCSSCHSLKLVTSNRGDRETWLAMIRWMQETQKLWQFDPIVEDKILSYLAKNYAPNVSARRAPIPEHLMPVSQ